MTDETMINPPEGTPINEEYFAKFSIDQLIFRAWSSTNLAESVLFDEESCEDSLKDARYEVLMAQTALRVLVRRTFGMSADELQEKVQASLMLRFMGEGETLQ